MTIQLNPAQLSAIALKQLSFFYLIEFTSGATIKRITTSTDDYQFGGDLFIASGDITDISNFEFNASLSFNTTEVELTTANIFNINLFFENIFNSPISIWLVVDESTPILVTKGLIESGELTGNSLKLTIEHYWSNYQSDGYGRNQNQESQTLFFPNDLGFSFSEQLSSQNLVWGNPEK